MRLEAPGLKREDFEVEVLDDHLRVAGEKRSERHDHRGRYHVTECAYGQFERLIPLPEPVKADSARASYRDGVLQITLDKAGEKRRRIPVEPG
ncbi:Hsp20/alpha crystallin family protein [Guyparkeria sp. 1SP6A2]|nr:Hsp20/alpha crystallin family protein [Guyparkeria sp. 1SP6A2]